MIRQLPLQISLRDAATFGNFHPGPNGAALHQLAQGSEPFVYLWGPPGSGRSHLLQALCHAAAEQGRSAFYLPLSAEAAVTPDLLEGMEGLALVAIDDLDQVAGSDEWERALFGFYNRVRACECRLVVAASGPPGSLGVRLPDLESRLAWGPVFRLAALDDADRAAALQLRARARGLDMPDEVALYLLRRFPRGLDALFDTLERLDQASMAAQRRLTVPFVRGLL